MPRSTSTCSLLLLCSLCAVLSADDQESTESHNLLAGLLQAEQASTVLAAAVGQDQHLVLSGQWLLAQTPDHHLQLGAADDDWSYPASGVLVLNTQGEIQAAVSFAAGCFLPSSLLATDEAVYVAGYAGAGFTRWLDAQGIPGLREHDPDFPQRDLRVYTPPEHHDEPRRDPLLDQRGAPLMLRFDTQGRQLQAAALLEGWQSSWFVPAQVRETWWQPVLLSRLSDGDVVVVHDGGINRIPQDGSDPGFADFCLAVDHVSRLSADLDERRWRRELSGPPIDAAAISAHIRQGIHFRRTRAESYQADTLGNPRAWTIATTDNDAVWVGGWSASRNIAEPWWCPFIRRIDADGSVQDGPWSPSPTAGDGRLGGQVSDTAVRAVLPLADGALAVVLISDGGNNVSRRDPWNVLSSAPGPWHGHVDPFRGRTLFWCGITRLEPDPNAPMNLGFAWGHHLGGGGRDQRNRPTQRPAWVEYLVENQNQDGLILAGRVADNSRIFGDANPKPGAFVAQLSHQGKPGTVHFYPQHRINALLRHNDRYFIGGHHRHQAFLAEYPEESQP